MFLHIDTIFIGGFRNEEKTVTIHRRNDEKRYKQSATRVSVPLRPDFLATNVIQSTKVRCMMISNWSSCEIAAADYDGNEIFTISPKIDGKQGRPYGITCDAANDGNIFVVVHHTGAKTESGNHHIHQYTSDGKFAGCIVRGLENPRGIALTKDLLLVGNTKSVEIYSRKLVLRDAEESNTFKMQKASTVSRVTGAIAGSMRVRPIRRHTFHESKSAENFDRYTPLSSWNQCCVYTEIQIKDGSEPQD